VTGVNATRTNKAIRNNKGMATNRLELLQQMVAQDPKNSFARYGLAMELANSGDLQQAASEFETLLQQDENYAAAYYHGGQAREKLGQIDAARNLYEKGIEVTTRKGDLHTRSEIEAALSLLPI
jgi:tetratricopeptide (TPR) repeat protein